MQQFLLGPHNAKRRLKEFGDYRKVSDSYRLLWGASRVPLLNRWNAFFLLNTLLDPIDRVSGLDVNLDFLPSQCLHLDHSSTPEPQDQMECRLLLNVVIS